MVVIYLDGLYLLRMHDGVCVCVCLGVNSFLLCLSDADDANDGGILCLYEALRHCRQLGALAVINADTQPNFTALVSQRLELFLIISLLRGVACKI